MSHDELTPLPKLRPGVYEHFKGNFYFVSGVERDSETLEARVCYTRLGREGPHFFLVGDSWSRPYSMWDEVVDWPDGKKGPRYRFVRDTLREMR